MRLVPLSGAFGSVFSAALVGSGPAEPRGHAPHGGHPSDGALMNGAPVDGAPVDGTGPMGAPVPAPDPFAVPRAALIVATSCFLDGSRKPLDDVRQDAQEMAALLSDPAIGAFGVTVLVDRTAHEIRLGIEDFLAERGTDDHMLIYLSGLVTLDPRGRLFFAATDTRLDRLPSTSIEAGWVVERLDECAARHQIVIIDTDHSGAFARACPRTAPGPADHGRSRVVLTSAGAGQRASEVAPGESAGPSLFTPYLAEGLRTGRADADADGFVTVDEAFAYVYEHVCASERERTPHRWMTGDDPLLLARTPRTVGGTHGLGAPVHDHATDEPPGPDPGWASQWANGWGGDPAPPLPRAPEPPPHRKPVSDPEVAHAMKVAQALDPAQALAAVQGLDAAQMMEVAQVLEASQVLEPGAIHAHPAADQPARGANSRRRHLGDSLVAAGILTPEQLDLALTAQRESPSPPPWIGRVVVELGLATERDVAECLAHMLGLELIDLSKVVPAPDVVRLLPRAVAERTGVLVIDRTAEGELVVAAADPTNVLAFDDVRLYTRSTHLKAYVATDSQIRDQLNRAWSLGSDSSQVAEIVQEMAGAAEEESAAAHWSDTSDEDAPIVRLVTQILSDAVRLRASDIHIEVQRDTLRVRYRVDGVLRDVMEAPKRVATSVTSRIKIISGLDIAERRIPQDGRTRLNVDGMAIDTRVSTLPSLHGEKVVIRLLTRGDSIPTLSSLGLEPDQLSLVEAALAVPQGLVLITGPTGSGKTNTLYSAIDTISSPELNIITLEDPVEVQLPGITQVGVSEKTGMTFSRGLRAILRQDPDIILVGEVRDGETAQLALKAAMTGHMVLTTLHTNSAVAALTRLVDMGVEPFAVASSLTISIAQRLVRRPCQTCAAPYLPDDVTLTLLGLTAADLASGTPCKGVGCHECGGTGYRGRTAVYEILDVDAAMRQVLMREPTESAIFAQAEAGGMVTLRKAAILKAMQGRTTFEEAIRVTSR